MQKTSSSGQVTLLLRKPLYPLKEASDPSKDPSKDRPKKSKKKSKTMNPAMMRKLTAMIRDDPNDPWEKEHTLSGQHEHVNFKLRLNYNFCWIRGRRPKQEDSHLAIRINSHLSMFGIFDGHGGNKVSQKVSLMIPDIFKERIVDLKTKEYTSENMSAALNETFILTDKELEEQIPRKKSPGSTAAIVLIHRDFIISAHCGDTKIILYSGDIKKPLNEGTTTQSDFNCIYESLDHRPSEENEAKRICDNGGCVYKNRISTKRCKLGLAVSRSFGDFMYKNILPEEDSEEEDEEDEEETDQEEDRETENEEDQDESETEQETEPPKLQNLVTALPDIRIHHTKKDKIKAILICCDGVTDVLKPDQIRSSYIEGKGSSAIIVRKAFANKSLDNISACCVNII